MASRIRAHDWSGTPLGPVEGWAVELKAATMLVLDTGFPAALVWGEGYTTIHNDGFMPILGPKPDALGRSFAAIWEEVWEEIGPIAERAYAGEATFIEDFPLTVQRSGQWEQAYFTFSYNPVRAADGSVAGMIGIVTETTATVLARQAAAVHDVTDLKRTAEALRESEERYRTVFEAMGEGFCLIELVKQAPDAPVDFLYLDANRAFAEKTGVENVVGKTMRQAFPGESDAPFDAYAAVLRTGKPLWLVYSMATQERVLELRAFRVGGPGSRRLAVLFEDVTERRAADEALRRSEQRHRAMLEEKVRERTAELQASRDLLQGTMDASTDMIQVFEAIRDEDGEIVDFRWLLNNHSSENRYGDLRGQKLLERHPGVVQEGIFDTLKHVTTTGEPRQDERHYVHEQYDGWFLQTIVKLNDGVATTSRDISAWKAAQEEVLRLRDEAAQAMLRESEERLGRFGEASQDILWMRDAETLQWQYLTHAFETIYGLTREEALAGDNFRSWLELIVPEDREDAVANTDRIREGEHAIFEYRIRRPADGAIRWLRNTDFPIFDEAGKVTLIGGIGEDITEAKLSQERLAASEERLRSATEVGRLGLWDWNVLTGEIHWSDEHFRMEGYAVGEVTPSYDAWVARIHPDDRADTEIALRAAQEAHAEYDHEFRTVHPDGSIHWLHGRGRFFYDDAGEAIRMTGAMIDTTERREWAERQQILVAELQHRTRNLMAVVRSMADKTMRRAANLSDFRENFEDRLEALARVQGLLSRLDEHDRVAFDEMIQVELSALGVLDGPSERVTLEGPQGVKLRSSTVQTLAMALHELATNAAKYGALGQPGGHLHISWRLEPQGEAGQPWLHIDWRERGVAMPEWDSEPQGTGQGRELIERALPYQLKAKTVFQLLSDGVHCMISIPVSVYTNGGANGGDRQQAS